MNWQNWGVLRRMLFAITPKFDYLILAAIRIINNRARLEDLQKLQNRVEQTVTLWNEMPDQLPNHDGLCHLIESVSEFESDLT